MESPLGNCFACHRGFADDDCFLKCIESEQGCNRKLCYNCFANFADDSDAFCVAEWQYYKFERYLVVRIFIQEPECTHEYEFNEILF